MRQTQRRVVVRIPCRWRHDVVHNNCLTRRPTRAECDRKCLAHNNTTRRLSQRPSREYNARYKPNGAAECQSPVVTNTTPNWFSCDWESTPTRPARTRRFREDVNARRSTIEPDCERMVSYTGLVSTNECFICKVFRSA